MMNEKINGFDSRRVKLDKKIAEMQKQIDELKADKQKKTKKNKKNDEFN